MQLDHEDLLVVPAVLDVLEHGGGRVHEDTRDPTELQLWGLFRRDALARQWTCEACRGPP